MFFVYLTHAFHALRHGLEVGVCSSFQLVAGLNKEDGMLAHGELRWIVCSFAFLTSFLGLVSVRLLEKQSSMSHGNFKNQQADMSGPPELF